jgi:hypothetical protein
MAQRIWTAAELEAMTPAEVDTVFRDSIVWDLDEAPPEMVARARELVLRRIEQTEATERP